MASSPLSSHLGEILQALSARPDPGLSQKSTHNQWFSCVSASLSRNVPERDPAPLGIYLRVELEDFWCYDWKPAICRWRFWGLKGHGWIGLQTLTIFGGGLGRLVGAPQGNLSLYSIEFCVQHSISYQTKRVIFLLREVASLNNLPCLAVTEAGFHYPLLSSESSTLMVGSQGNGDQASQGPEHLWIVFLPLYDLPRQGR